MDLIFEILEQFAGIYVWSIDTFRCDSCNHQALSRVSSALSNQGIAIVVRYMGNVPDRCLRSIKVSIVEISLKCYTLRPHPTPPKFQISWRYWIHLREKPKQVTNSKLLLSGLRFAVSHSHIIWQQVITANFHIYICQYAVVAHGESVILSRSAWDTNVPAIPISGFPISESLTGNKLTHIQTNSTALISLALWFCENGFLPVFRYYHFVTEPNAGPGGEGCSRHDSDAEQIPVYEQMEYYSTKVSIQWWVWLLDSFLSGRDET